MVALSFLILGGSDAVWLIQGLVWLTVGRDFMPDGDVLQDLPCLFACGSCHHKQTDRRLDPCKPQPCKARLARPAHSDQTQGAATTGSLSASACSFDRPAGVVCCGRLIVASQGMILPGRSCLWLSRRCCIVDAPCLMTGSSTAVWCSILCWHSLLQCGCRAPAKKQNIKKTAS